MSAIASTANIIIIIHTCLLSLQLLAMTSLSFLRFMSIGPQLIQMNFLSFWPSFKLPATLSFLSPSPCVNSTFLHLIIFFWYGSSSNQIKVLFHIFFLSSATHSSLSPSNKEATFSFILLFLALSLKTVFLCLLCTQVHKSCVIFCFGFLDFVFPSRHPCTFFFLLKKKVTLKKKKSHF